MSETLKGVVKWFNDAKGFGFIEHKSGKDVFVHYSVIQADGFKTLKDGETVEYELNEGSKGLHAARVFRLAQPGTEGRTASEMQVEVLVEKSPESSGFPTNTSAGIERIISAEDR